MKGVVNDLTIDVDVMAVYHGMTLKTTIWVTFQLWHTADRSI